MDYLKVFGFKKLPILEGFVRIKTILLKVMGDFT